MTAVSENWKLTSEAELPDKYDQDISWFWQQRVASGHLGGEASVNIHYAYALHPESRGDIVISNGRIESLVKYKEVMYDLYENGFSVFALDHRGQGKSGRMDTDAHKGFVRHFDDYVADFERFMQKVVNPNIRHQPNLLCHSMGSAIGALYLLRFPHVFASAAFCAPMFGIQPALPVWLSKILGHTHVGINKLFSPTPWYFPGQRKYESTPFNRNVLTQSPSRYELFRQEYEQSPEIQLGGVTGHWLLAAVYAMHTILTQAPRLTLPVFMLQAQQDKVVHNASQDKVLAAMPNGTKQIYADSEHEILMERDSIRNAAMRDIMHFFTKSKDPDI